jgi:myo-inositol-1(or 4)-monophosphatase
LIFEFLGIVGKMAQEFGAEELKQIYDFALDLGRRAGRILVEGVEKRTGEVGAREEGGGKQKEKMNAVDIVTQTDFGT